MKLPRLKREIPRRPALFAAALIVAAGVVAGREKPALERMETRSPRSEQAAVVPELDLEKLKRAEAPAAQSDPFAPRSFEAVREAAPAPARAAPPAAPPLPFNYAGRLTQDGRTEVFVTRGDELISIAAGQKIDAQYRVDSISATHIRFTYLPLKTRQALALESDG